MQLATHNVHDDLKLVYKNNDNIKNKAFQVNHVLFHSSTGFELSEELKYEKIPFKLKLLPLNQRSDLALGEKSVCWTKYHHKRQYKKNVCSNVMVALMH